MREDNWPLLTVSKGFFEQLATKGGCASEPAACPFSSMCSCSRTRAPNAMHPAPSGKLFAVHPHLVSFVLLLLPPACAADSERAKGAPGAAAAAAAAAMEELDMGDVGAGWGEEDDLGATAAEGGSGCGCWRACLCWVCGSMLRRASCSRASSSLQHACDLCLAWFLIFPRCLSGLLAPSYRRQRGPRNGGAGRRGGRRGWLGNGGALAHLQAEG